MGKRSPLRLAGSAENVLFPGALPLASAGVGGFDFCWSAMLLLLVAAQQQQQEEEE